MTPPAANDSNIPDTPRAKSRTSKADGRNRKNRKPRRSASRANGIRLLSGPVQVAQGWLKYWQFGELMNDSQSQVKTFIRSLFDIDGQLQPWRAKKSRIRQWPSRKLMWRLASWPAWTIEFVSCWLTTRPVVPMMMGLPALVALMVLLVVVSAGGRVSKKSLVTQMQRLLATAIAAGDSSTARFAADALVRQNSGSSTYQYERALLEERLQHRDSAQKLMAELALSKNSAKAALWLANAVGDTSHYGHWTDAMRQEHLRWLTLAYQSEPSDPLPRHLLADALRNSGDYKGAYNALLPIADLDHQTTYELALLEQQLGKIDEARSRVQKLERVYKKRIADNPQDIEAVEALSSVLLILARPSEAVEVIQQGLTVANQPEQLIALNRCMTEVMVAEAAKMSESDTTPRGLMARLEHLRAAIAFEPNSVSLRKAVALACTQVSESHNKEREILAAAIPRDISPQAAHMILGTIALYEGNQNAAFKHIQSAVPETPKLPEFLGSLADEISHETQSDLNVALRLSNAAVYYQPDNPELRRIRGAVFFALDRYRESVADFNIAQSANALDPASQAMLDAALVKVATEDATSAK